MVRGSVLNQEKKSFMALLSSKDEEWSEALFSTTKAVEERFGVRQAKKWSEAIFSTMTRQSKGGSVVKQLQRRV